MKCKNCQTELSEIKHVEHDGESGSPEPYWVCPNGCAYPECEDTELTPEELKQRGKVDTMTEYGIVKVENIIPPVVMKSNPWNSVDEALDDLINKVVLELNPEIMDDDLPDACYEWDSRVEAIEYIVEKLAKMKEEV